MAAIDVGALAQDRTVSAASGFTMIELGNPANLSGVLTRVSIYAFVTLQDCKVGTFYDLGAGQFACRDYANIGTVAAGAERQFLNYINVEAGDYIGIYFTSGELEADAAGGSGHRYKSGDQFDAGTQTYTLSTGTILSLYGDGATVVIPLLSNSGAVSVEETTATLRGTITHVGGENCNTRGFDWGYDAGVGNYIEEGSNSFGVGGYSKGLTGLNKGDKVYYRATAHNSAGDGTSTQRTFITEPAAPASLNASNPTKTTIDVSWTKGDGAYYTYVRCKAGSYPTDYADGIEVHTGTGTSDTVAGLNPGTTYYFRAWSRAYDGEWGPYSDGYDSDIEETLPDPALPTVTTEAASDVGQTTATGNGTITATGNGTCDKRGIVYGTASQGDPGNVAPGASGYDSFEEQADSYGVEAFTRSLTGLIPDTAYFARAYAHNETGYSYGSEVGFDTKPAPGGSGLAQAALLLLG